MHPPISAVKQHGFAGLTPAIAPPTEKTNSPFLELIQNKKAKRTVNYIANGGSFTLNFFTFLNGNFHFLDSIQDGLEKSGEAFTKVAYSIVSLIGAIDIFEKKNPLPFIGFSAGVPLSLLSTSYNLWLANGIPYGLGNFIIITDQREVVDENGEPVLDKDGNVQLITGDFKNKGWKEGLSTTYTESLKIIKELIQKPQRIKKISHSLLTSSVFEMFGPVISCFGLEKIGSFIRSTGTIATHAAMLLHNDSNKKTSIEKHGRINLKSLISQGALLGISASAVDFIKRSEFISENISNLTNLSLGLDRGMSALFMAGMFDIEKEKSIIKQ